MSAACSSVRADTTERPSRPSATGSIPALAASPRRARSARSQSAVASAGRRASLMIRRRQRPPSPRRGRCAGQGRTSRPGDVGAVEQPLHRALRVLFVDFLPGRVGQLQIEPRQHHRAPGRAGDGGQQFGVGRRGAGRAGGDHQALRRVSAHWRPGGVRADAPLGGRSGPVRPAAWARPRRPAQEIGGDLPVLGQVVLDQAIDRSRASISSSCRLSRKPASASASSIAPAGPRLRLSRWALSVTRRASSKRRR